MGTNDLGQFARSWPAEVSKLASMLQVEVVRWWRRALGWLAETAGLPGFVCTGEYRSKLGPVVSVRTSNRFTIITVNGVEVYFYRGTGRIDGIGYAVTDCRQGVILEPERFPDAALNQGRNHRHPVSSQNALNYVALRQVIILAWELPSDESSAEKPDTSLGGGSDSSAAGND